MGKLIAMCRKFFCDHKGWAEVFVRNIYGDEINRMNGKRSMWVCSHCGEVILRDYLWRDKEKA